MAYHVHMVKSCAIVQYLCKHNLAAVLHAPKFWSRNWVCLSRVRARLENEVNGQGKSLCMLRHERDPEPNAIKYIASGNVAVRPPISGRCRDLSG